MGDFKQGDKIIHEVGPERYLVQVLSRLDDVKPPEQPAGAREVAEGIITLLRPNQNHSSNCPGCKENLFGVEQRISAFVSAREAAAEEAEDIFANNRFLKGRIKIIYEPALVQ